jgi:O-antigen ligase
MSRQPGFVPVNYGLAGAVLLGLGLLAMVARAVSPWLGGPELPSLAFPFGIILSLVGLYILWTSRRRNDS